jgi:hypothetical protein
VNGLQFPVGSEESLAATMRAAAGNHELWERLAAGIGQVRTMDDHAEALESIYRQTIASRAAPSIGRAPMPVPG